MKPKIEDFPNYFQPYAKLVPEGDPLQLLSTVHQNNLHFLQSLDKSLHHYRYELGKWSIQDIVQHLIDAEKVFCYRAMRFAREDKTDLPGYDHNQFAITALADYRDMQDLLEELHLQRQLTVKLFKGFSKEMLSREGTANQNAISVMQLMYIIIGHEMHHIKVIKERYLG